MSLIDDFNDGSSSITLPPISFSAKHPLNIFLFSDIHLGSRSCNLHAVKSAFNEAVDYNARIGINGDLIDGILPRDLRRFVPSVVVDDLLGRDDLINATVDYVVDFLKPYRDRIDFIGEGNHETAILKHHNIDILDMICRGLSTPDHKVHKGEYTGSLTYILAVTDTQKLSYSIAYTHGSGGNAPVTKGLIEFNRILEVVEGFDAIWAGHNHQNTAHNVDRKYRGRDGMWKTNHVQCVRTPGFLGQKKGSYAAKAGYYASSLGYCRVKLILRQINRKGQPRKSSKVVAEYTPVTVD